ncbi:hypothetical protein Hanom_Chr14g01291861 [Helianthus anomalus]
MLFFEIGLFHSKGILFDQPCVFAGDYEKSLIEPLFYLWVSDHERFLICYLIVVLE